MCISPEVDQRWCRDGAEVVVQIQRWCRGGGADVTRGAGEKVQRWCRCRGGAGAEVVQCRGGTGVVQCTCGVGWCGGASAGEEVVQRWCRGGVEVVWRWTGAEVNWCSRGCEEEKVQRY